MVSVAKHLQTVAASSVFESRFYSPLLVRGRESFSAYLEESQPQNNNGRGMESLPQSSKTYKDHYRSKPRG